MNNEQVRAELIAVAEACVAQGCIIAMEDWLEDQASIAPAAHSSAPSLIGMAVSMDVSTGDEDGGNRIFGTVESVMPGADSKQVLLAVEESRNFAAPAPTGESLPVQGVPEDVSYELVQDDMVVAGASGPTAEREMRHYAAVYGQDGPVEIFKVTRRHVDLFSAAPRASK